MSKPIDEAGSVDLDDQASTSTWEPVNDQASIWELCERYAHDPHARDSDERDLLYQKCLSKVKSAPSLAIERVLSVEGWLCLSSILKEGDVSGIQHLRLPHLVTNKEKVQLCTRKELAKLLETGRFSTLETLIIDPLDRLGADGGGAALAHALRRGKFLSLRSLSLSADNVEPILEAIYEGVVPRLISFCVAGPNGEKPVTFGRVIFATTGSSSDPNLAGVLSRGCFKSLKILALQHGALGRYGTVPVVKYEKFPTLVKAWNLGMLPALKILSLKGNELGDCPVKSFAGRDTINFFRSLEILELSSNKLQAHHGLGAFLCPNFRRKRDTLPLRILKLDHNLLGNEGIACVTKLAETDRLPQLQELDLSFDRGPIDATSLERLANAIEHGHLPSLQTLNWSGNPMSDEAARAIVQAYTQNKALTASFIISWDAHQLTDAFIRENSLFHGFNEPEGVTDPSWRSKIESCRARNVLLSQIKGDLKQAIKADAKESVEGKDKENVKGKAKEDVNGRAAEEEKILDEEVPVTSAKVFLCGFSEVGKTTLRKTLKRNQGWGTKLRWERSPVFVPESRTRGIELCRIEQEQKNGEKLMLVFWDLAGQEEYHVLHGALMPDLGVAEGKATTFLVVLKAQFTKAAKAELLYWLKFVASSSQPGVRRHVLIVLNCFHGQKLPDDLRLWTAEIENDAIKFQDYLRVHSVPFAIDVRVASSVKQLKTHLFRHAGRLLEDVRVPRICLTLLQDLKLNERPEGEKGGQFPILSWEEFERKYKFEFEGYYVRGNALKLAASYLHEFGEIIYFKEEALEEPGSQSASEDVSESRSIVVANPEWFCRRVVGQLLLPKRMLDRGENSVKQVMGADGSILIREFQSYFQHFLSPGTPVEYVISMLVRLGLCYRMENDKVLVPALIQEENSSLVDWEGKGAHWVMGRCFALKDQDVTAFPMTLFRFLQVELAKDRKFGGGKDSSYRVGKTSSSFKVGELLVLLQCDVNPSDPTDDRVDILVKSSIRVEDPDLLRERQIDLICDIMSLVDRLCLQCCPGVRYDKMVIKPWSAADEDSTMSQRELLSVSELKSRIEENRSLSWQVGEVPVRPEMLLSLKELKISANAELVYEAIKDDTVILGLMTVDSLAKMEGVEFRGSLEMAQTISSDQSEDSEVIDKKFFRDEVNKVVETIRTEAKHTRQHFSQRIDELAKEMRDHFLQIQEKQNFLLKHVQALQSFSILEKERSVPRYMYLSKRGEPTMWITLREAFKSSFRMHLLCEARFPDGIVHEVNDQEGIEMSTDKDWLVKVSPWFHRSVKVAVIVAKIAGNIVIPGISQLIPDIQLQQGTNLVKVVDTAATVLSKHVEGGQGSTGKYGSAEAPINGKETMIAEAILGDLMREIGHITFASKIGLQKVVFNPTCQQPAHSSTKLEPSVVWICNNCYQKYGDKVTDITQRC